MKNRMWNKENMEDNVISRDLFLSKKFVNRFKKLCAVTLTASMIATGLTGCGKKSVKNDKLTIVATIFPEYDWVMNILGDKAKDADVTLLLDNGVDLHSYSPSADDILKIKSADVFIYVGGESDEWVDDVLKDKLNKDMKVINLVEELGESAKEEEIVEGMQGEDEHDHDHEDGDTDEHDHEDGDHHDEEEKEVEYDEHTWLSTKNAIMYCEKIEEAIASADSVNKDAYKKNLDTYKADLEKIYNEYEPKIKSATTNTIVCADRFPFRYMVDEFDLEYYAAFVGCSAESEASFETIDFLSKKIDELNLKSIFVIENSDEKIAKTVIDNTKNKDAEILVLDSMQSVTKKDIENGKSYKGIMEENYKVLEKALNN